MRSRHPLVAAALLAGLVHCGPRTVAPSDAASDIAAFSDAAALTEAAAVTDVALAEAPDAGPPPCTGTLSVNPLNAVVGVGGTLRFTATHTRPDGTSLDVSSRAVWTSSSPSAATIDATGLATGVSPGVLGALTRISATLGECTAVRPATLTVAHPNSPSLSITPGMLSLTVGDAPQQLVARAPGSDGSSQTLNDDPEIRWSSGSATVAAVDPRGRVTALSPGEALITVRLYGVTSGSPSRVTVRAADH